MDDNEKLIEEAASIVYGTVPASVIVPWHELDKNRRVEFEDAARAIRDVFEKTRGDQTDAEIVIQFVNRLPFGEPDSRLAVKALRAALRAAGGVG